MSPALTTPKMPIPEPMVVIVGMMSNFPAWWGARGGGEGLAVSRGPVGKVFLRSPKARPGVRQCPFHCQLAHCPLPRVCLYMATQGLARSLGLTLALPTWTQGDSAGGVVTAERPPSTVPTPICY